MMKRALLIMIAVVFLAAVSARARSYKGKEIHLFGNSAEFLGRAGTGVASSGTDFFYLNPASIGDAERIAASFQYGTLPLPTRFYDAGASLAVPTSYGVFGGSFRYLYFPGGKDFREGYSIGLGVARDITRQLLLGFSLDFLYGRDGGRAYYAGGALGFIYKFPSTPVRHGFCLMDPRLGLSVHFGYPFGDRPGDADLNEVTLGFNFTFVSISRFTLGWFTDFTVLNYREFPVKLGLEAEIYNILVLRGGYVIPHAYNDGNFTAGLGLKLNTDSFKGSLNYAINFYPGMKYVHYCGVNFEYGELDRKPPETGLSADNSYISPNHDGLKDYVLFGLSVHDRSRIKGWKLQVMDDRKEVIKDYSISERGLSDRLTAQEFFKRLFQKRESTVVPERVIWDGTDGKGEKVPDGAYTYSFSAWDERDNIALEKTGTVMVDATPPEVFLEKTDDLFSPNGDGRKDFYVIIQKIKTSPDDTWVAGFRNDAGEIVKTYTWLGYETPPRLIWNGKDDSGKDLPEGLYSYFMRCTDKAGNAAQAEIKEITLTRKYETADITFSSEYFSFGRDAVLNMFPVLSSPYGLLEWKVAIMNSKLKVIREISGGPQLQKIIPYDCTDASGSRLDDGVYYARLRAVYKSGNEPVSFNKMFIVDSTPPSLSVSHSPRLFSPDGDRENDLLTFFPRAKDDTGVKSWNITIYASSGDVFKTFTGNGQVPDEILWDGLGDRLDIVESASDYKAVLEAVDMAGNRGASNPDTIEIDVLVLVTERGLKIRISNIEFPFGSDEIKYRGRLILDRVAQILQKYENYDVIIEGHTDDIGKEEYNLELSERRAKSVNDYLVGRGIRVDRLKFVGMGETVPLYPNDGDENRRRNRRVEFMLIKQGTE